MFETNASDLRFTIYAPICFPKSLSDAQIVNWKLFHSIDQRRKSLDADFEAVAGFDWPHAAGRAGQDYVAGQQRHVRRDKAEEMVAVEDELAGVWVLPQVTIQLFQNGQLRQNSKHSHPIFNCYHLLR